MPYIARYFYKKLNYWATDSSRKPLIIRGARQVGKSFTVRNWAKEYFKDGLYCEINFEERPDLKAIFDENLDIERIIDALNLSLGVNLRAAKVLLFLDEIQVAPKAIMALRYFYEKFPQLYVIAAGSLIEFVLDKISFPVGRVDSFFLKPICFSEFLEALGKKHLVDFLNKTDIESVILENIHQELLSELKNYFYVGGMPKAVAVYLERKNLKEVSQIHSSLLSGYQDDFIKYSKKSEWGVLKHLFEILPAFTNTSKIVYSKLGNNFRIEKLKSGLFLLENSHLVTRVFTTNAKKLPLKTGIKFNFFKLIFLDIGLLQHALGFDWRSVPPDISLSEIYNGKFAEQFVAQEMIASRSFTEREQICYWQRNKNGSDAEVDFVVEYQSKIAVLEVKSGKSGSLKSLQMYKKEFSPNFSFVLSQRNTEKLGDINFLPLYFATKL